MTVIDMHTGVFCALVTLLLVLLHLLGRIPTVCLSLSTAVKLKEVSLRMYFCCFMTEVVEQS